MICRTHAVAAIVLLSVLGPVFAQTPGRAIMTDEEKTNYEILLELTAAFNAHDLDRIMAHFAEDASLDMPGATDPGVLASPERMLCVRGCRRDSKRPQTCTMATIATGCQVAWASQSGC